MSMSVNNAMNHNSFLSNFPLDVPNHNRSATLSFKEEATILKTNNIRGQSEVMMMSHNNMSMGEIITNNTTNANNASSLMATPNDLCKLHWKSPAAKTRAARKRRMAKNRVALNDHINIKVQEVRSKSLGITRKSTLVSASGDPSSVKSLSEKGTPTLDEKVCSCINIHTYTYLNAHMHICAYVGRDIQVS